MKLRKVEQKKLYWCCLLILQMHKGSRAFRVGWTDSVTDVVVFGWDFFPFNPYTRIIFMYINKVLKTANVSIDTITPINLLHSSLYLHCFISFLDIIFVVLKELPVQQLPQIRKSSLIRTSLNTHSSSSLGSSKITWLTGLYFMQ